MKRACIAVVDAARARLYTYDEGDEPTEELREVVDLVNPGRRLRPSELFSDSRPGLATSGKPGSGERGSAYDDHRGAHIAMMDTKFAGEILHALERIVTSAAYGHLIIIASPKMLGELRKAEGVLRRPGLVLEEIPRDLAKLTSSQLHDHLASLELIPPRRRLATAARRA